MKHVSLIKRGSHVVFIHPLSPMWRCEGRALFDQTHEMAAVLVCLGKLYDYQIFAPFPNEITYVNSEKYKGRWKSLRTQRYV